MLRPTLFWTGIFIVISLNVTSIQAIGRRLTKNRAQTVAEKLPDGIDDNRIEQKLEAVEHSSEDVNTGKGQFSKIRDEDREAADLAFKLLKLAEDSEVGETLNTRNGVNSKTSSSLRRKCPFTQQPQCNKNNKFREIDGSCNNLKNPLHGRQSTPFNRISSPEYGVDLRSREFNLPRRARSGKPLPSPRVLSQDVLGIGERKTESDISTFFVQMGQFIDHDLTLTPEEELHCCDRNSNGNPWVWSDKTERFKRDRCIPIRIPEDDRQWGGRRTCFDVRRSSPALNIPHCQANRTRQQTNSLTHWLDASNVYGSNQKELSNVREGESIYLQVNERAGGRREGRAQLPSCQAFRGRQINSCGSPCDTGTNCKVAGDHRVNEQPGLTTQHTIWLREHNRLAKQLQSLNTHWDQERVFQETRRLVIAEWQHIVYKDWLPIVLGQEQMEAYDLFPQTRGYSDSYDEDMDPRINNEFATAAFRFGHSMMPALVPSLDKNFKENRRMSLHQVFNNVSMFLTSPNLVDDIIRGQTMLPAAAWDPAFNEDITNKLFHEELDLVALNINRGRDHGLPGYNTYRGICRTDNYNRVRSWDQLKESGGQLSSNDIDLLSEEYTDVDDIDLFVGGTMEESKGDSLLGPAFSCIIADQFLRLKEGDRFYYENGDFVKSRFSQRQLDAIRKVSIARIICDNTDIEEIQPNAFRTENSDTNRLTPCNSQDIPQLDISVFKDL